MKTSTQITIKAAAKARREEEIRMYGKPIRRPVVFESHKTYKRKRYKYDGES